MKKQHLIKQDIKQKYLKTSNLSKPQNDCPPILGKKLYNIKIDTNKYIKSNAIFVGILCALLVLSLVKFIITFNHWLVITIAFTAILSIIVWTVLSVKRSLIKVEYSIYENYLIKAYEDWCTYASHEKFMGYKLKRTILDRLTKRKTYTLILYYSDKYLPVLKLSCIDDDVQKIIDIIIKCNKAKNANKS